MFSNNLSLLHVDHENRGSWSTTRESDMGTMGFCGEGASSPGRAVSGSSRRVAILAMINIHLWSFGVNWIHLSAWRSSRSRGRCASGYLLASWRTTSFGVDPRATASCQDLSCSTCVLTAHGNHADAACSATARINDKFISHICVFRHPHVVSFKSTYAW